MKFGEKLLQMLSKGIGEIGQEINRLNVQARAEIGSGLFSGSNAYVPYGPGQNSNNAEHGMEGLHGNAKDDVQRENDGHSM